MLIEPIYCRPFTCLVLDTEIKKPQKSDINGLQANTVRAQTDLLAKTIGSLKREEFDV